jgi:hypothetical protein
MKKAVFRTRKRENVMPSSAADLEDLLVAYLQSGTKYTIQSRADSVAASFSKDGNIYRSETSLVCHSKTYLDGTNFRLLYRTCGLVMGGYQQLCYPPHCQASTYI